MLNTILIVDDEDSIRLNLQKFFKTKGHNVLTAATGEDAINLIKSSPVDIVLLDLQLPDMSGIDVLKKVKAVSPATAVIIITAYGDVETAVKAMQAKADNFVLKPVDLEVLEAIVNKVLESYRAHSEVLFLKQKVSKLEGGPQLKNLRIPKEIHNLTKLLAEQALTNVMIMGETGTGKGIIAKTIHELSSRKNDPFIDINCAGLSSEFLASELFGHEKGAFTDAKTFKKGLLEIASNGSVFLDEIGELSMAVQAKLLKVIEQKTFRRLGGTTNIEVNVRIMAATNINLEKAVKERKFRKDLFFRLNVIPIVLPPLRERRDDILPLAQDFLDEFRTLQARKASGISPEAESMLLSYSWPGNIRELKNVIERATLLCGDGLIMPEHLPENLKTRAMPKKLNKENGLTLDSLEKNHIEKVLAACNNNRSEASKLLGIHRSTLIKKLQKYHLDS